MKRDPETFKAEVEDPARAAIAAKPGAARERQVLDVAWEAVRKLVTEHGEEMKRSIEERFPQ